MSRSPSDRRRKQAHAFGMATIEDEQTENDRVAAWRFEVLVRTGYSPVQARRLAAEPEVDLRVAERLLAEGCPPDVAARILG